MIIFFAGIGDHSKIPIIIQEREAVMEMKNVVFRNGVL